MQDILSRLVSPYTKETLQAIIYLWTKIAILMSPFHWEPEYDYVIVGGGVAGSVLANRLSEDPSVSVLLLEAGSYENFVSDVPYLAPGLQDTAFDWNFASEPQTKSCLQIKDQKSRWSQGKALGGTSVINFMLFVRGNAKDFSEWVRAGAKGWSYDDNLPYFLKVENYGDTDFRGSPYHGTQGLLPINHPEYVTPLGPAFVEAGKRLGYHPIDYNGASQMGFAISQTTTYKGSRVTSAKAYLRPIKDRKNVKALTYATASRVLFDKNKRATGVVFDKLYSTYMVKARKEVILSAGALNTPKLLMRSGIGPAEHLREYAIPVVANLPGVGQNLQDHIAAGGMIFLVNTSLTLIETRTLTIKNMTQFLINQNGALTSPFTEALGFINTKYGPNYRWPDFELIFAVGSILADEGHVSRKNYGITDELWSKYAPYGGMDSITIFPVILNPKSKGYVRLQSTDPSVPLRFEPKYFDVEEDMQDMVRAMQFVLDLVKSPSLAKYGPKFLDVAVPGCEGLRFPSRKYLECAARAYTVSFWHFSGTASMGSPSDRMSVVDPELRVHGVQGLRVIDASVMPAITSGNIQAPTYMIAERGADFIKGVRLRPIRLSGGATTRDLNATHNYR